MRLRHNPELLNEGRFSTMSQARVALAAWREDYNVNKPHSVLGNIRPNEFAERTTLAQEAASAHQFNPGST